MRSQPPRFLALHAAACVVATLGIVAPSDAQSPDQENAPAAAISLPPETVTSPVYGGVHEKNATVQSDPFFGDFRGQWTEPEDGTTKLHPIMKDNPKLVAQVIALGDGLYQIAFLPEFDVRCPHYAVVAGRADGDVVKFDDGNWAGTITRDAITADGMLLGRRAPIRLERVERQSPTFGLEPPSGAVVLFDGNSFDQWQRLGGGADQPINWQLQDGAMKVNVDLPRGQGRHSLATRQAFEGDYKLHMEFCLPLEPKNRGQGRANSGVFVGGYEVQILDSYGLPGYYNQCGSLYKLAAPRVNMCYPPQQWQTFDIEFHDAQFDGEGNLVAKPWMTVDHNGVRIHDHQVIHHHTSHLHASRDRPFHQGPRPITLQNHNNAIAFRNIWLVPLPQPALSGDASP